MSVLLRSHLPLLSPRPVCLFRLEHKQRRRPFVEIPFKRSLKPLNCARFSLPSPILSPPTAKTLKSLSDVKPYLQSQSVPILCGWLCSVVSVLSLSQIVPRIGSLTSCVNGLNIAESLANLRLEGLVLAALVSAKLIASYLQQAFLWEAALNAVYEMRVSVFERVLARELGFFEGGHGISPGDIAYRITAEASDVADTIYALLNTVVPSAIQISAMGMQMLAVSPILTLISAMAIPCMALVIAYLGERLRKISEEGQRRSASLSAYLNEVLPAILFVKANNAEISEITRFQRLARADLCWRLKKKKMKSLIPQIIQFIYIGSLFVLCVGSLIFSGTPLSSGTIVPFLTSLVFLIEPIQGIGKSYNELKQGEPAIDRLFDLSRFKPKVVEKPNAIQLENVAGELKFCDLSFRYGENLPFVLDKLNFHVKAGETIALAGPSGGGKTTLVKLLLRLYEPSSGYILIDDHDINDIKLESLRRHVGLVSQDITLFSGTVAENIGYRDLITKVDMDRVEFAAQTANAEEFIRTLPDGYNTNIGPRGSSLSGGQKQRLALARAVYQGSSILVLDEATSALDSRSELLVREALQRLMENHTVIVIAHRLETVLMAERVFLLENGKLNEVPKSVLLESLPHNSALSSSGLVI